MNVAKQIVEKNPKDCLGYTSMCIRDSHSDAWPQAGLNQAYMVYEIIVEGGETRLMALFKGVDVERIGPVRSARPVSYTHLLHN